MPLPTPASLSLTGVAISAMINVCLLDYEGSLQMQHPTGVQEEGSGVQKKKCGRKYGWRCQKLGVGMAMCRQGKLHKDYTSNPIPTSFLFHNAVPSNHIT